MDGATVIVFDKSLKKILLVKRRDVPILYFFERMRDIDTYPILIFAFSFWVNSFSANREQVPVGGRHLRAMSSS